MSSQLKVTIPAVQWCLKTSVFCLTVTVILTHSTIFAQSNNVSGHLHTRDILMKGAKPFEAEAYLCAAYPVEEAKLFIYKFEALADASTAHHMLMYGCSGDAYSSDPVWSCPAMCRGRSTILFAWAKNAPPTSLPKGVGVRIGQDTTVKNLVIQVHYARAFAKDDTPDNSGIRIYTTDQEQPFVAGIFLLLSSSFAIPPNSPSYAVDVSCVFSMKQSIFPFAYRTHAHKLGKVITGYQYNGTYHLIGKGNPQWPQAFYPVEDRIEVKYGNILAARCTFNSSFMDHYVSVGSTGADEMCNFYIMYYTNKSVENPSGMCSDNGRPDVTGKNFPPDVSDPLPPNSALEEMATGHHHSNGMSGGSDHKSHGVDNEPLKTVTIDILMPGAKPELPDAYLCTAYHVNDMEAYIYKYEALANVSTAHHMLLYGCDGEPYSDQPMWNCPAMCKSWHDAIMFAWAKNAPPTVLPQDVGFRIGKQTSTKTLVLQVHYAHPFKAEEAPDSSGIRLHVTYEKPRYVAGIFLMAGSSFYIPPGEPSYHVDISCRFNKDKSIFPFAFRTHTHSLGTVVTGYQYNTSHHQIGKGNPQWPQAFYTAQNKIEIKSGDCLAARCTYNSTYMNHEVAVGSTGQDEMCNFYIMYYTDRSVSDPSGVCSGNNIEEITGDNFPPDVSFLLPLNPELEEEAKGHHHHSDAGHEKPEGDIAQMYMRRKSTLTKMTGDEQIVFKEDGMRPEETKQLYKNVGGKFEGRQKEILQYDYDFDDPESKGRYYMKRQQQEYYENYAANDDREKGLYGPAGPTEEGLSRNRNREFEAMNQQLQHFPRKNPLSRPLQQNLPPSNRLQQQNLKNVQTQPQQQMSELNGRSDGNSEPRRPLHTDQKLSEPPNTNPAAVDASQGGPLQAHSHIHFGHSLIFNASWPNKDVTFGQVGGVATDKEGNVYVFHRGSRTWTGNSFTLDNDFTSKDDPIPEDVIVVLGKDGQLLRKFGAGEYFMPHGIEVDQKGNIWLTDVAMHQVFKIPAGSTQPSLVLGKRFQHSDDPAHFCKPTDVAVLSSEEFFVSDGYCNGRILKFSKDGKLTKMWGQPSPLGNPPVNTFSIPHGITVSEENQLVLVADRENGRIQCFDLEGNFKHVIQHKQFGSRLFAIEQCPVHGILYAVNGPAYDNPAVAVQGFTLDIKTGELLEMWDSPEHLRNPHDVCVDPVSHSVYVGELNPSAVWKFSRAVPVHQNTSDTSKVDTQNKKPDGSSTTVSAKGISKAEESVEIVSDTSVKNNTLLALNGSLDNGSSDFTPSLVIGCLLVVPVVLLLIITLLVRAHQSGKLKCYGHNKKRVFSLQGILGNSHKGFDPLSTEESDHELDPDNSDQDEYMAPRKMKNKA